jgi:hypothetical protein
MLYTMKMQLILYIIVTNMMILIKTEHTPTIPIVIFCYAGDAAYL